MTMSWHHGTQSWNRYGARGTQPGTVRTRDRAPFPCLLGGQRQLPMGAWRSSLKESVYRRRLQVAVGNSFPFNSTNAQF